MSESRRRTVLFLLCAVVLLGAGYAWGTANAYDRFYAPDAALDRELVHLDFNSRVLHYANLNQGRECRRALTVQLRQQMVFVDGLLPASSPDTREDGTRKLRAAERVVAGLPINGGGLKDTAPGGK